MVNPVFGDRVQESFTTTGTGTISLGGAVVGYQAFSAIVANLGTCYYTATDGTNWEVGIGTYTTSGNTLTRTTILASSNSGSAVNWAAGTKNIWLDLPAAAINAGPLAGFRNKIINGDFRRWDYATSSSLTSSAAYQAANRWAVQMNSTAAGIFNQDTSITAGLGFKYNAKVGRNNASSSTGQIYLVQALESTTSIPLAGQQITLSFYAKAGANFSAASSQLAANLYTSTGTDQSAQAMISGTWTNIATPITATPTLTTSWQRFSYTVTLNANVTQLGVAFTFAPVGTAGADDNFYVTGVQLEFGSIATPFEDRGDAIEDTLCQRFYEKSFPYGTAPAQNASSAGSLFVQISTGASGFFGGMILFRTRKRAAPTIVTFNPGASNANWRDITNSADRTVSVNNNTDANVQISGSGGVAGAGNYINWTASAEL
jgi:hypothetical protein